MNYLINNEIMLRLERMEKRGNKRIIKIKSHYHLLKNIKHNAVMKGIQILTESAEEKAREEGDKQIIRLEEDITGIN